MELARGVRAASRARRPCCRSACAGSAGFGVTKAPASSQTCCHLRSIACGFVAVHLPSSRDEKASRCARGRGKPARRRRGRFLGYVRRSLTSAECSAWRAGHRAAGSARPRRPARPSAVRRSASAGCPHAPKGRAGPCIHASGEAVTCPCRKCAGIGTARPQAESPCARALPRHGPDRRRPALDRRHRRRRARRARTGARSSSTTRRRCAPGRAPTGRRRRTRRSSTGRRRSRTSR